MPKAFLWMLFACLLPTLLRAAEGPSFDCSKARGPVERAVCGSAELSQLDRTLTDAYQTRSKAAAASAETVQLRTVQRQWLAARAQLCFPAGKPLSSSPADGCLALLYRQRIAELKSSAKPAEYWQAYSNTAMAITGDLLLSETTMVMAGGYELQLQHVKQLPQNGAMDGGFEGTRSLELYRIVGAKPRTLLNGNALCSAQEAPAYVVVALGKDGSTMSLAFFSGTGAPVWEKQALSTTHALCGTFSYGKAPGS